MRLISVLLLFVVELVIARLGVTTIESQHWEAWKAKHKRHYKTQQEESSRYELLLIEIVNLWN